MAAALNPTIFRAYDIRGIVDTDLTDEVYFALGQASGTFFLRRGPARIVVARDARLSSPRFQASFIAGALSTGLDVIDVGQVPTPVMYFALEHLEVDGGAIISASHNPPEYNGLKLRRSHPIFGGEPLGSEDIQEIGRLALNGIFASGQGALNSADVTDAYVASVSRLLPFPVDFHPRVVLDGGNGVAGPIGLRTFEALGFDVVPLFIEPDGTFPNHHPDPLKAENLQQLIAAVREHKASIGIALDGDGDRLGVVDGDGTIIYADRYLIVLATYLLAQRKGPVVFDVKCSAVLARAIRALGGEPIMWKTGYSSCSAKMREVNAVLGGELSGHTFSTFPGHYYDDGTFAGAHLIYALYRLNTTLSAALEPFPELPSLDEGRIPFDEAQKFKLVDYLVERFKRDYEVLEVDGCRVEFGDGWGLVRASNTEPAITTRFEAESETRVREIRDLMLTAVADFRTLISAH
jgi:phosphomannomutase